MLIGINRLHLELVRLGSNLFPLWGGEMVVYVSDRKSCMWSEELYMVGCVDTSHLNVG